MDQFALKRIVTSKVHIFGRNLYAKFTSVVYFDQRTHAQTFENHEKNIVFKKVQRALENVLAVVYTMKLYTLRNYNMHVSIL